MLARLNRRDEGFGIVEVLVAMMLFGIIMISAAPALIGSLKRLGETVAITAATEYADEKIALARQFSYNCSSFGTFLTENNGATTNGADDPRKNSYRLDIKAWQDSVRVDPTDLANTCNDSAEDRLPIVLKIDVYRQSDPADDPTVSLTSLIAIPGVE